MPRRCTRTTGRPPRRRCGRAPRARPAWPTSPPLATTRSPHRSRRPRPPAGRYWPLEAALWDIIGKACGQSVATLFGGARSALPAYASFGEAKSPAERADAVLAAQQAGFRAVKIRIGRDDVASGLAAVRAA